MKNDILSYIKVKWPNDYNKIIEIINIWDAMTKGMLDDRLLRSVLFISNGSVESVEKLIELSRIDYRDVFWQDEYDCTDTMKRDFNKTYYENKIL